MMNGDTVYSYRAILLSGTPASGKDTITAALHKFDDSIIHFKKHRAGTGGMVSDKYVDIDPADFDKMQQAGDFVQSHMRYDRFYGVSSVLLNQMMAKNLVPVIHVGPYENLVALRSYPPLRFALSILLLCPRDEALLRLEKRHSGKQHAIKERIKTYDEERLLLQAAFRNQGKLDFDIVENTVNRPPDEVARSIISAMSGHDHNGPTALYDIVAGEEGRIFSPTAKKDVQIIKKGVETPQITTIAPLEPRF